MAQKNESSLGRKLYGIITIRMKLINETGLLIKAPVQAQMYKIGGEDQYPMTLKRKYRTDGSEEEIEVPYIPASSLKGRMRGLLEIASGAKLYTSDDKIWQHVRSLQTMGPHDFQEDVEKGCAIDELFGWAAVNLKQLADSMEKEIEKENNPAKAEKEAREKALELYKKLAPTRLLVSDFFPSEEYVKKLYEAAGTSLTVYDFLEDKSENRIDRITSAADPRSIVRVKPGVEFEGDIKILLFDNDSSKVELFLKTLVNGLKLIETTYLGASGSRGYGRVKFKDISVELLKVKAEDKDGAKMIALESKQIPKKEEIGSLEELEKKVAEIAKTVQEALYQQSN